MEKPAIERLAHFIDEVRRATNFGLTYWLIIVRIARDLAEKGEITLEQVGTNPTELTRFETALAEIVPQF